MCLFSLSPCVYACLCVCGSKRSFFISSIARNFVPIKCPPNRTVPDSHCPNPPVSSVQCPVILFPPFPQSLRK
ncbi:hypothetical protein BZA05DRAFT_401563 [Tricharina praecox]|uniref:uncharacterized protein n=1 Tax=Tricharina praecox TaxID=43433 RepID=UPI00221F7D19|nr:uncharacterized protein BZA05DRAFT_401563 [Tricharina praecox]KAI5849793.1 hypothetical protein BZA05DRAFT_401563 [Tricharina praecox]